MTTEAATRRDEASPAPVDYAALNALYALALAGIVLVARGRGDAAEPVEGRELVPLAFATFALAKAVSREKIGSWIRDPLLDGDRGDEPLPRRRLRHTLAELVTCSRCVGTWSALALVGLRTASPAAGRTVTAVFAVSGANDWAQAGFRWLCARSNEG